MKADTDTEEAYNLITDYYQNLEPEEFNQLLSKLIIENMDVQTINTTVRFLVEHSICDFLSVVEDKCYKL